MLISKLFLPLIKEAPSDATVTSHKLMLRSGMIRQHASGIYNWLPLGLKVMRNIEQIIRRNMEAADCNEILMPCVQNAELWHESGRYDSYGDELLRFKDRNGHELLFGPTNEEAVTDIIRNNLQSYKDLPKILYQFQWKFRDERRPRFGLMRGREFYMKDAYSVDIDEESAIKTYYKMFMAYMQTFRDLGLNVIPLKGETGEIGGDLSHEFHVLADVGESTLYYDKKFELLGEELTRDLEKLTTIYAATDDVHDPSNCPVAKEDLAVRKGIEVGQIFNFSKKYSEPMKATVNDRTGKMVSLEMGSYGIGVSRLVAAIIESSHDDKGIIWPTSVAPFKVSVININPKDEQCRVNSNYIYNHLISKGVEVLYDDTSDSPGMKLARQDLIGTPWQVIIGPKNLRDNKIEIKQRSSYESELIEPDQVIAEIINNLNFS